MFIYIVCITSFVAGAVVGAVGYVVYTMRSDKNPIRFFLGKFSKKK